MRRSLALTCTALLVAATSGTVAAHAAPLDRPLAPLAVAAPGTGIPGSYIVTMRGGSDVRGAAAHFGAPSERVFSAVSAFSARLSDKQLAAVRADPDVAAVEADQVMRADTTQASGTNAWGIDRIDQRRLPLSKSYSYKAAGEGVTAYVIDSGIQRNHPQFGTRASWAYDALGGIGDDCNGHGTHVAGIIGASYYGVAKAVKLKAVRVLDCSGAGSTTSVIAGVNYVRTHKSGLTVANLSLDGPKSDALNAAVTNLVNSGVGVAVAAGNGTTNACNRSPASASGVLTVGAVGSDDRAASFSNYGGCVELYAPGVSVSSTWIGSSAKVLSGTSMAAPHVTGVLALRMTKGAATPAAARSWIISAATTGIVVGEPAGTPDRLLYKASL